MLQNFASFLPIFAAIDKLSSSQGLKRGLLLWESCVLCWEVVPFLEGPFIKGSTVFILLLVFFLVGSEYLLSSSEDGSVGGGEDLTDQPAILHVSPITIEIVGQPGEGSISSVQGVNDPLLVSSGLNL